MKRLLVLTVIALLTLGLVGTSGCSKKVAREANVAAGDYYTEEEYGNLSKEQREAYCADLATELDRLSEETTKLNAREESAGLSKLKQELSGLQSQFKAQRNEVSSLEEGIRYFESLPTSYHVLRGDCLWHISGKEQIYADPIKWPRLYRANRDQINDPDLIYPDQVLTVPRNWPKQHMVLRGEWLSKIAGYWEVYDNYREWPRLYEANRDQISDPDLIYPDQILAIPR